MRLNNLSIRKIVTWGLFARIFALILVLLFSDQLSTGFISSSIINDDVRYIEGGYLYAKAANFIIDRNAFDIAFSSLNDNIYLTNALQIWYWFVCIGLYIFKNDIVLRLFNIVFALLSIRCIFDIANKMYSHNVASLSSLLYAISPYSVFFSCFLYKDQLYTLVTLLLLKIAVCYGSSLKKKHVVYIVLLLTLSALLRSGLAAIIAVVVFIIIRKEGNYKFSSFRLGVPLILGFVALLIFGYYSMEIVQHKFYSYVSDHEVQSKGLVNYFLIKSPTQLLKYPFSMFFMTLLPVNLSMNIISWNDLVCCLNIMLFPVAFGNFLYFFCIHLKKDLFWWLIQILYLVTIITSIEIFRHSYYLLPFTMIFFSVFYTKIKFRGSFITVAFIPVCLYYILYLVRFF